MCLGVLLCNFVKKQRFSGKNEILITFPSVNAACNARARAARAEGAKGELGPRVFEDRQRRVENGGGF